MQDGMRARALSAGHATRDHASGLSFVRVVPNSAVIRSDAYSVTRSGTAAPPQQEHSPAAKQRRCAAASQEKETEEKNKDVDFEENNVLPPRVAALTPEKEKQKSRGEGRRGSDGFARPMS